MALTKKKDRAFPVLAAGSIVKLRGERCVVEASRTQGTKANQAVVGLAVRTPSGKATCHPDDVKVMIRRLKPAKPMPPPTEAKPTETTEPAQTV